MRCIEKRFSDSESTRKLTEEKLLKCGIISDFFFRKKSAKGGPNAFSQFFPLRFLEEGSPLRFFSEIWFQKTAKTPLFVFFEIFFKDTLHILFVYMVFWVGENDGDSLFAPKTFAILIYWFENASR